MEGLEPSYGFTVSCESLKGTVHLLLVVYGILSVNAPKVKPAGSPYILHVNFPNAIREDTKLGMGSYR